MVSRITRLNKRGSIMLKFMAISLLIVLTLTMPYVEAGCSTTDVGNQAFTNCDDGLSGSSQTFGNDTFYQFNDGTSGSIQSFGNTKFSNSNRQSLRGSSQILGNTGFSQWNDGVAGMHQRLGNVRFDRYSDGTSCTTQTLGTMSFTNCNGDSQDAVKRGRLVGDE